VSCRGKRRKERITPPTRTRVAVVRVWLAERAGDGADPLFPTSTGAPLSRDAGGRYRPTFHEPGGRGGRTIGTKRTLLVEILGLPVAADACSARPHDVVARELLRERIATLPRLRAIIGDRAFAQLGRWRRLSRCYEGTVASARTWLQVASVRSLAWRVAI